MPIIVLADGTVADTEGATVLEGEITDYNDPADIPDYADQHGVPLNNILHAVGYTV